MKLSNLMKMTIKKSMKIIVIKRKNGTVRVTKIVSKLATPQALKDIFCNDKLQCVAVIQKLKNRDQKHREEIKKMEDFGDNKETEIFEKTDFDNFHLSKIASKFVRGFRGHVTTKHYHHKTKEITYHSHTHAAADIENIEFEKISEKDIQGNDIAQKMSRNGCRDIEYTAKMRPAGNAVRQYFLQNREKIDKVASDAIKNRQVINALDEVLEGVNKRIQ